MSLAFVASASCNALPVRLAQFFRSRSKLGDMCCVRQRARLSCEDCFPCFACPAGPPGSRSPRFAGVARGAVLVREHPWTLRSRPGAVAPACVYVRLVPLDRNQLQQKNSFPLFSTSLPSASSNPRLPSPSLLSEHFEVRASRIEVSVFLAFGGPPVATAGGSPKNWCVWTPGGARDCLFIVCGPPLSRRRRLKRKGGGHAQ